MRLFPFVFCEMSSSEDGILRGHSCKFQRWSDQLMPNCEPANWFCIFLAFPLLSFGLHHTATECQGSAGFLLGGYHQLGIQR